MTASRPGIYLDYNATAPLAAECMDAVVETLERARGNPSSKHHMGEQSKTMVNVARAQVAALLKASAAEVLFTSGGTESNHHAIVGALALQPQRRHVVTSVVEHASTLALLRHLEQSQGVRVTYVPVDSAGRIDPAHIAAAVTPDTALVTLLWANNETGVVSPVHEAARCAQANGALFHTDAVQAVGKIPIDVTALSVDLISVSGHKLHAPTGIGALYVRKGVKLPPLLHGHQERSRRGGTENIAGIVAFGVAALLAGDHVRDDTIRIAALRDRLEQGLLARIPGAHVNGAGAERVANTSNIRFGRVDGDVVVDRLDRFGICVSQGAACSAGGSEPSHVLTAMGLPREGALASLRFSLGRYTTTAEIDTVLAVLPQVIATLPAVAA